MNKNHAAGLIVLVMLLLVTACSSKPSWDEEHVHVESERLLADLVAADWKVEPPSDGGKASTIRIQLKREDGRPIESFDRNHEQLLHLMVISRDLSYFHHIHPAYQGSGVFEIANEFPAGGDYRLIADFKPTGGDSMTKLTWMRVDGPTVPPVPVVPDAELAQTADGNRVKLAIDRLEAKRAATLTFTIEEEGTGQPVTDLQPYLGAIGHVVVLSDDGERYVHVHAEEGQGSGPVAQFEAQFPKSGVYKIWGQFMRNDRVFTVAYVVTVA